jgi:hypothetical protein
MGGVNWPWETQMGLVLSAGVDGFCVFDIDWRLGLLELED